MWNNRDDGVHQLAFHLAFGDLVGSRRLLPVLMGQAGDKLPLWGRVLVAIVATRTMPYPGSSAMLSDAIHSGINYTSTGNSRATGVPKTLR